MEENELSNNNGEEIIKSINKIRINSSILLIYPDSKFRTLIDTISFLIILCVSIYIPFVMAFDIMTN